MIATASLRVDWRRFVAIIGILAMSGVLFMMKASAILNQVDGNVWLANDSRADLIVKYQSDNLSKVFNWDFSESDTDIFYTHPNIEQVQIVPKPSGAEYRLVSGSVAEYVHLLAFAPQQNSLSLPYSVSKSERAALEMHKTFLAPKSFVIAHDAQIGDEFIFVDNQDDSVEEAWTLVGEFSTEVTPDWTVLITSPHSLSSTPGYSLIAIALKDDSLQEQTMAELNTLLTRYAKPFTVVKRADLRVEARKKALLSRTMQVFVINAIVPLAIFNLVTIVLIMRANLFSQIREFGTLHALGFTKFDLAKIAMEQGLWLGAGAIVLSTGLFYVVAFIWQQFFGFSVQLSALIFFASAIQIMFLAILGGALSIGILKKVELTSLLR
ncbi:FtsX-like permease family protein [Bowmanella pacifica]|uniref:ABC3 transporter permease C-terminal domain-containing protein n=1 Tax=Bowmanella pacifica TaxID=502051 RepID=A0A917Z068_9ALTE|nr:ABC transporter permease [Bowmanella pacifica]GGO71362.1 hypothetical protein GCM10010982_26980 [Bowmanella pacifica]